VSETPEERLVEPGSRSEWRSWLEAHGAEQRGVWLVLHKGKGQPLAYSEAVEEALAAGWIDGKAKTVDAARYKIWITPRKQGSVWSPSNKERVARLTAAGLMTPRGEAAVEAAKADGSWTALDEVIALEIPADLREALEGDPAAADFFARFPASAQRIILHWILQARSPNTRQRRIEETVSLAAKNIRAPQPRR
jgi:uncharacterized protein YdeI (YjbR/CyaY-like superfamily)